MQGCGTTGTIYSTITSILCAAGFVALTSTSSTSATAVSGIVGCVSCQSGSTTPWANGYSTCTSSATTVGTTILPTTFAISAQVCQAAQLLTTFTQTSTFFTVGNTCSSLPQEYPATTIQFQDPTNFYEYIALTNANLLVIGDLT
jgi:hypothetical protein